MSAFCPASCEEEELLANPPAPCLLPVRKNSLARWGFKLCSVSVPENISDAAFKALVDDGSIVFSSEIANFAPGDPSYQETIISDCKPFLRTINTREMVFDDRISVTFPNASPALINYYGDYAFWQDKIEHTFQMDVMAVYCTGDVIACRDINGNFLSVNITVFLNWERANTQGQPAIEFKRVSMVFNGDPFALYNTPFINLNDAGIIL